MLAPAPSSTLVSTRRGVQLIVGLFAYGFGIALMLRAGIGVAPWDVLAQGIALQTGLPFGLVVNLVGALVLLLWIPIRQKPGLGTVTNVLLIGPSAQIGLAVVPQQTEPCAAGARSGRRTRADRSRHRALRRRTLRPRPARRPDDRTPCPHRLADLGRAHRHRGDRARRRLPARRPGRHRNAGVRAAHRTDGERHAPAAAGTRWRRTLDPSRWPRPPSSTTRARCPTGSSGSGPNNGGRCSARGTTSSVAT